jgi:glucose-1-phosphate cytidylyltransferase
MKVVLFCGGQGMRLRDHDENVPKPLVKIGYRPIIWHVMKYYAHFGHKDFILALGHQATAIKNYFLQYSEYESNDFILTNGGRDVTLLNSDIADWRITFVDTGLKSSVGERLAAVRHLVEGEE